MSTNTNGSQLLPLGSGRCAPRRSLSQNLQLNMSLAYGSLLLSALALPGGVLEVDPQAGAIGRHGAIERLDRKVGGRLLKEVHESDAAALPFGVEHGLHAPVRDGTEGAEELHEVPVAGVRREAPNEELNLG